MTLKQAQKQNVASEALINNTDSEEALVKSLKTSLAMAEWELSNTEVRAPSNGYIAGSFYLPVNLFCQGNLFLP
ncbi:hypothetical protein IC611_13195 [Proteus mirabilis]